MKTTTIRISEDLWALLEGEAARTGVSASQYIREAALARAAFAAGTRSEVAPELLARWAENTLAGDAESTSRGRDAAMLVAALNAVVASAQREDAEALRGEHVQAMRQAEKLSER